MEIKANGRLYPEAKQVSHYDYLLALENVAHGQLLYEAQTRDDTLTVSFIPNDGLNGYTTMYGLHQFDILAK